MEPTDEHLTLALTADQIERIAVGLIEQYGPSLTQTQFNDVVLGVFENVAGLEGLPSRAVSKLLVMMWKVYCELVLKLGPG